MLIMLKALDNFTALMREGREEVVERCCGMSKALEGIRCLQPKMHRHLVLISSFRKGKFLKCSSLI